MSACWHVCAGIFVYQCMAIFLALYICSCARNARPEAGQRDSGTGQAAVVWFGTGVGFFPSQPRLNFMQTRRMRCLPSA